MHIAITGASSGIGAALARELARVPGVRLTLVARRKPLLDQLAAELGVPVRVVQHDLSDPARAADWIAAAEDAHGPIEILVNNAGAQVLGPTATTDVEQAEETVRLDLLSPLRLTRALLPAMLARRAGMIVDISSLAALAPTPGMTWYNAAKGGLAAASEALRGELRGTGVHVVTVYPGIIGETDMAHAALKKFPASRMVSAQPVGTAAALARLVRAAIEKRQDRVIYPRVNTLARWLPAPTRWLMDRLTPPVRA